VYLPFWSYASDTRTQYAGERGEHYFETEYYTETDSNGRTIQQSRQVQRTRWQGASGEVAENFTDLLIPATRAVNQRRLVALEPWDLQAMLPSRKQKRSWKRRFARLCGATSAAMNSASRASRRSMPP
jgi:hypothetical protein